MLEDDQQLDKRGVDVFSAEEKQTLRDPRDLADICHMVAGVIDPREGEAGTTEA